MITSRQNAIWSVYSGVGQLIINSFQVESRPRLILVIPEEIHSRMEECLKSIRVECLMYKHTGKDVTFKKLKGLKLFEQGIRDDIQTEQRAKPNLTGAKKQAI